MAVLRRRPEADSAILHSDHGTRCTSWAFGKRLRDAGLPGQWPCVREADDVQCSDEQAYRDVYHKIVLYRALRQRHWSARPPGSRHDREDFFYREELMHLFDAKLTREIKSSRSWNRPPRHPARGDGR